MGLEGFVLLAEMVQERKSLFLYQSFRRKQWFQKEIFKVFKLVVRSQYGYSVVADISWFFRKFSRKDYDTGILKCSWKNTINKKQQKTHIKYNKNLIKTERYVLLFVDAQGRMAYNGCI